MSKRLPGGLLLLTILPLLLVACGGGASPAALVDVAPLDTEQPTFLFFYTEG